MMASHTVGTVLQDLKGRLDGIAAALVARDGSVLYADLPVGVFAETFSVMCAAIVGAGVTAHGELRRAPPERIVVDGADSRTVIVCAGTGTILVVAVQLSMDLSKVFGEIGKFAGLLDIGERSLPDDLRGRG